MQDAVIRPTMKFIRIGYVLVLLAIVAGIVGAAMVPQQWYWMVGVPTLLLIWPIRRHISQRFIKGTIAGDKLRYEVGALSKSTRNISLPKVQDVRVDQSVMQRMFDIGNIAIETAGEASRLILRNVDHPQKVAEEILAASHQASGGQTP